MDDHDLRLVLVELTGEVKGIKETMSLKLDNMLTLINTGDARNAQISEALRGSLDVVSKKADENSRKIEELERFRVAMAPVPGQMKDLTKAVESLNISRAQIIGIALAVSTIVGLVTGIAGYLIK